MASYQDGYVAGPDTSNWTKDPSKYPYVGSQYLGEDPSGYWIYDPYSNEYRPNQQQQEDYYASTGIKPKEEKPSLASYIGPVAAGAGAIAGAEGLVKDPKGFFSGIKEGLGDAYNFITGAGETAPVSPTASAQAPIAAGAQAANTAAGAAPFAGYGAQSVGGAMTIPAGQAIPAGYEAVGTALDGGTLVAPAQGAAPFSSYIAPGLGIAAGTYGLYDLTKNRESSDLKAGFQGAASGAALGAGLGSVIPGAGTLIGGAIGAGAGALYGLATSLFGGDGDKWKTEKNNLNDLRDSGVYIPDNLLASMPTKGRSKDELINHSLPPDFIGFSPDGTWVNNKFAQSRDVSDLRAEDIVNYSAFAEHDPNWFHMNMQDRLDIANQALQVGAVKEGKGSISIDWNKLSGPASHYEAISGSNTPLINGSAGATRRPSLTQPSNKPVVSAPAVQSSTPFSGHIGTKPAVVKPAPAPAQQAPFSHGAKPQPPKPKLKSLFGDARGMRK